MNQFFSKLHVFFSDKTRRTITLLCGCTLLAAAAGIGAAIAFSQPSVPAEGSVDPAPSVSLTVSDNSVASSSFPSSASVDETSTESVTSLMDSSDSIVEEKEPVQLKLVATSYTQDLNVNIVDETGALVRGVLFQLRITGLDKHNNDYDKPFDIDLKDGNLYLSWIPYGSYRITIREEEGFITADPVEINIEEYVIVYEKIEDIADQIVDESDVNVSEDDNAYGSSGNENANTGTPPPTATDTVKYVESSKKTVTENLKDGNGNQLYDYTYEVGANGYLLLTANNAESDVKPVLSNSNVLTHGVRYVRSGSTADAAQSTSTVAFSFADSILFATKLSLRLDDASLSSSLSSSGSTISESAVSVPDSTTSSASQSVSSANATASSSESTQTSSAASSSSESTQNSSSASQNSAPGSSQSSLPAPSSSVSAPQSSAGSSSSASDSTTEQYTVTFINPDGSVLNTGQVTVGGTASAPASPSFTDGSDKLYQFTGWSGDYTNVRQDLTITAVYDIFTPEKVSLFNADNTPVAIYKITAKPRTQTKTLYTGWQTIDGKTYYYTEKNEKVTGWQVIQSISYFFNTDGVRSDCMGIDVSRWNGTIDWKKAKESGIDFAIIRVGYRGYGTGKLVQDPLAVTNLKGASAAGIKIGVYVFSQAINLEEAVEEASMALEMVKGYKLDYPIFIDSEYSTSAKDGRADSLSTAQRTAICEAFCKTIANSGYRTGIYASKSWFMYQLNVAELEKYHIWVAHYTTATDYARRYDMWQYTSTATVPGISGGVDMNFSYLNY